MSVDLQQQRVRTAIVLLTLALTSLFSAQGGTRLLAGLFLALDPRGLADVGVAQNVEVLGAERRQRTAQALLHRNMFDSAQGPLDGTVVEAQEPTEVAAPVAPDGTVDYAHLPRCEGTVRLMASFYVPQRPERSIAQIVDATGKSKLYRSGMTIDSRNILFVRQNDIVLQPSGAGPCALSMFAPPPGSQPPQVAAVQAPVPTIQIADALPAPNEGVSPADLDSGITRTSDTEFRVSRTLVNRLLENQGQLMNAARVVPHEEGGRVVGVKLYGIRRNSLLGRLGLQNGDVVRTINGYDMSSPDTALEAYARLRNADNISINVNRRGAPTTVNYGIQ